MGRRPVRAAAWLRSQTSAPIVHHVLDSGFASYRDEDLYRWAEANKAIIVTYDEDLADRRLFPPEAACGVVRLKVEPTDETTTRVALGRVSDAFAWETLRGRLAIVDVRRIRLIG